MDIYTRVIYTNHTNKGNSVGECLLLPHAMLILVVMVLLSGEALLEICVWVCMYVCACVSVCVTQIKTDEETSMQ